MLIAASSGVRRISVSLSSLYQHFYAKTDRESGSTVRWPARISVDAQYGCHEWGFSWFTLNNLDKCNDGTFYRLLLVPFRSLQIMCYKGFRRSILWGGVGILRPTTCSNRRRKNKYINIFTNLLTLWSRVLLEKLTCLHLIKKFPAFHGTPRFITALTSAHHLSLSWANSIQPITPHPTS
jgi:hypothetical protein